MSESSRSFVRPTKRCLDDLELRFPPLEQPLHDLKDPVVAKSQQVPQEVAAGGAQRIRAIEDRIWFKVKVGPCRGAVTELAGSEAQPAEITEASAWWWLGAAGRRQEGSGTDFYRALADEVSRAGRGSGRTQSGHLLPAAVDIKRLRAELAVQLTMGIKRVVRQLVAGSIRTGRTSTVTLSRHRISALVRAQDEEAYLAITAEGFIDPRLLAVILASVPHLTEQDWIPEPKGVFGIHPEMGQIVYSALIPPVVQAEILDELVDDQ
ncbi:hypothetical protein [Micromonospora yangpuensis]|uniref:hypothetical protein n=1 Tax=Micromonospora yangpuensis TaxID=683228 RepID=UPI001112F69F|nr:hypothetical protein [Micromonospora yangpuensis]